MIKQMKTSTKISLKFTIFTIIIVFLFGIAANLLFFSNRYKHNNMMTTIPMPQMPHMKQILGRKRWLLVEQFPIHTKESVLILKSRIRKNISKINNRYFLFNTTNWLISITDVTQTIESQENLLRTALYLLIGFALLAYLFSLFFIKNALKNLQTLVIFAQNLDLDKLNKQIEIPGPDNDEIKILANTLNTSFKQLHKQAFALKDFVAHASHELRTPLMAMNTEIDLGIKSKNLNALQKTKKYIIAMNELIQQLLVITQLESEIKLKTKKTNIEDISKNSIDMIQKKYANKKLKREIKITKNISLNCHIGSREMILQNLLDNAAKYTKQNWKISVNLNEQKLSIQDNWIGIDNAQLEKIRDRFRQEDPSRTDQKSFGLWLYLVKKLVDKHWRKINIISKKWTWTECIVNFYSN